MTDRGTKPLNPWTASKTVGTMKMIRDFDIKDEETFVEKFQKLSKMPLEILTDLVYQYQLNYFSEYKYDKETIFKYTYCCVVLNSLQGNATENIFDNWASKNGYNLKHPKAFLNESYHTDRVAVGDDGKPIALISVKPNSFSSNFLQYRDVFAGLQYISKKTGIPWKIYFRNGDEFELIEFDTLSPICKIAVENWSKNYR